MFERVVENAKAFTTFQFERIGFFAVDQDSTSNWVSQRYLVVHQLPVALLGRFDIIALYICILHLHSAQR